MNKEELEKINDDKIKICIILQRSCRFMNEEQINQIKGFLETKGDYFEYLRRYGKWQRKKTHKF